MALFEYSSSSYYSFLACSRLLGFWRLLGHLTTFLCKLVSGTPRFTEHDEINGVLHMN